jgi:hypothetical protein
VIIATNQQAMQGGGDGGDGQYVIFGSARYNQRNLFFFYNQFDFFFPFLCVGNIFLFEEAGAFVSVWKVIPTFSVAFLFNSND